MFEKQKKEVLAKRDKSIKGSVDKKISGIISLINKNKDYYTTSSCSGRILLIVPDKKRNTEWIYVSHDKISLSGENINRIKRIIMSYIKGNDKKNKIKRSVFLKQEGFILHVCCRDIESAKKLIGIANNVGVRRSGITSINEKSSKIIVEVIGSEHFEALVARDGRILVDDDYLKEIIKEANKRLDVSDERLKQLYSMIKKELRVINQRMKTNNKDRIK